MANYYHLYTNNPTAGAQDGTIVSENRLMTSPISVMLDALKNESKAIKCAIRCEEGFETAGYVLIQPRYYNGSETVTAGGNIAKWKVAPDLSTAGKTIVKITANGVVKDTINIGDVALTAGTDFAIGNDINATAFNINGAINLKSKLYTATVDGATITLTENAPGAGNTPTLISITGPTGGAATLAASTQRVVTSAAADETMMLSKGVWDSSLTIKDKIDTKNYIFWIKVSATSDEAPAKDVTTMIHTEMVVQAV